MSCCEADASACPVNFGSANMVKTEGRNSYESVCAKLWDGDNRSEHGRSRWRVWRRRYCEDCEEHHFRLQLLDVNVADEPKEMVSYASNLKIVSCQNLFTQLNKVL